MLEKFYQNHVLSTLTFVLVLAMGVSSYFHLPREKNPTINYNMVQITTSLPGASAWDVEKLVTNPLEDAIAKVMDVTVVSSESMEGVAIILLRFGDISGRTYDRRLNDLRREIQNAVNAELPAEASAPNILEVTSSSAFPTATVIVSALANDENLRKRARSFGKRLERIAEVEKVDTVGLNAPEIVVRFIPERLARFGVNPATLADIVGIHFRDVSAGTLRITDQQWAIRLVGSNSDMEQLARLSVRTKHGKLLLSSLAHINRGREKPTHLVRNQGRPAVMLSVTKRGSANTLILHDSILELISKANAASQYTGVKFVLMDDQTASIRSSIDIMQSNALLGLVCVLLVTMAFLGWKIAVLTAIGIPFTLAGTFWVLDLFNFTLNNSVLLAVVLALGMLVDDAVVVVEAIYLRLQQNVSDKMAVIDALHEVFAPVTASVLTTIAAFLPLMLAPGILGQYMMVVPLVITLALGFSLIEAFWMLPVHIQGWQVGFSGNSRIHTVRLAATGWIQRRYLSILIYVMRRPKRSYGLVLALFLFAIGGVIKGLVPINFFAIDSYRLFYVDVEMHTGTALDITLKKLLEMETIIHRNLQDDELREIAVGAGQTFTKNGTQYGQLMVTLHPQTETTRNVEAIIDAIRPKLVNMKDTKAVALIHISDAPNEKPISIKIRGDDYTEINQAAVALRAIMEAMPTLSDIGGEDSGGRMELDFQLNAEAALDAGIDPQTVARIVRLMVDGEVVASVQEKGEKVEVRVVSERDQVGSVDNFLRARPLL